MGAAVKVVTDPEILRQLNGGQGQAVTDPKILDQLNAPTDALDTPDSIGRKTLDAVQSGAGGLRDLGMGAIRGAGAIGSTLLWPIDAAKDAITGNKGQSSHQERVAGMDSFMRDNADPNSLGFKEGEIAAQIAGTAGMGGALAQGIRAFPMLAKFAPALESGGFNLGKPAATTLGGKVADMATRVGAGAVVGGASAGLVNPGDAGAGALIGGALPPVAKGVGALGGAVGDMIEPFRQGGREQIIARALRDAAGGDEAAAQAIARLRDAGELIPGSLPTAGQAAGNAGIAALERSALAKVPKVTTDLTTRLEAQNAARIAALEELAGSPATRQAAEDTRATQTGQLRDLALNNANFGTSKTTDLTSRLGDKVQQISQALRDRTTLQTRASQNAAEAANRFPGVPLQELGDSAAVGQAFPDIGTLARKAAMQDVGVADIGTVVAQRQAERDMLGRQLDSLRQSGYSPLNAGSITKSIEGVLSQPGIRASDVAQKSLGAVRDKLAGLADVRGNIDARDLYTVRKEIGNVISSYAKETNNWDKRLTAGLEQNMQGAIDNAIRKAGAGNLWDQYLSKYQELSKPLNQMDTAGEILKRAVTPRGNMTLDKFSRAVSDDTAKSATGYGKATLEGTMTPEQMQLLNALKQDLQRADFAKTAGISGSDTAQKLAYGDMINGAGHAAGLSTGSLIGYLVSKGAQAAGNGARGKIAEQLATSLLSPQETARLMTLRPAERTAMLASALMRAAPKLSVLPATQSNP